MSEVFLVTEITRIVLKIDEHLGVPEKIEIFVYYQIKVEHVLENDGDRENGLRVLTDLQNLIKDMVKILKNAKPFFLFILEQILFLNIEIVFNH